MSDRRPEPPSKTWKASPNAWHRDYRGALRERRQMRKSSNDYPTLFRRAGAAAKKLGSALRPAAVPLGRRTTIAFQLEMLKAQLS